MAMYSVLDNSALIKKIYVPKYIFTLSRITSTMVDFVFSLGALLLVMLVTRTAFTPVSYTHLDVYKRQPYIRGSR